MSVAESQPNYAQLRAFHAVATEGGFTAAARRLRLTQPAVTVQVRALEQFYGVDLFYRRGRLVQLSETGAQLLAITRRYFSVAAEAHDLLSAEGGLRRGRLRLGADGPFHVVALLSAFRLRHPTVQVSVTVGNSLDVRQSLLDYACDVAVLAQITEDPALYAIPFSRHPVVVFVSKEHRWATRRSVRLRDLKGEAMVRREAGSSTRIAFDSALEAADVRPEVVLEIASREAVREAVAAGMGIGVVSEPELGHDDRLHAVRIVDVDIYTEEHVVCLRERRLGRLIHALIDIASELAPALNK